MSNQLVHDAESPKDQLLVFGIGTQDLNCTDVKVIYSLVSIGKSDPIDKYKRVEMDCTYIDAFQMNVHSYNESMSKELHKYIMS